MIPPELKKAIDSCKANGAILVISGPSDLGDTLAEKLESLKYIIIDNKVQIAAASGVGKLKSLAIKLEQLYPTKEK